MTLKQLFSSLLLFVLTLSCSSNKQPDKNTTGLNKDSVVVREDFKPYFDSCSVAGSIVIYDHTHR